MLTPRFLKSYSPVRHCFTAGPHTLDVLWRDGGWRCIDVCDDGFSGVELACGLTVEAALVEAVRELGQREAPAVMR